MRTAAMIIFLVAAAIFAALYLQAEAENNRIAALCDNASSRAGYLRETVNHLQVEVDSLKWELASRQTRAESEEAIGYYLVVDIAAREFRLRKGDMIIREGPCAVGKGYTNSGNNSWNFQTPTGERRITVKKKNPAWNRPSWYWQEKGERVPDEFITFSPNMPAAEREEAYRIMSRRERNLVRSVPGELGKYSLGLGDGYYIHYGKQLGQAASHGCVRVGADDLEAIYKVLEVGDPVYIY